MRTVLLISFFCPPVINAESILVWKTLKELNKSFTISVITSDAVEREDSEMKVPADIHVFRKSALKARHPLWRKVTDKLLGLFVDEHFLWTFSVRARTRQFSHCDLIYSRSHPGASHILAYKIHRKVHKPWVAQFSDPWADNPYHRHHTSIRKRFDAYWERRVVLNADALVFPTREIQAMFESRYGADKVARKSMVLPHHYMPELYKPTVERAPSAASQVSFAYFGDFYGARSPQPFIDALHKLSTESPDVLARVGVRFTGNVASKFAAVVNGAPVRISRNKMTYLESLRDMTQTGALLLIDAPSQDGVNPFLPSKLVDYLGAGKPILGITNVKGSAADILRQHGHLVVCPDDVQGIADCIQRLVAYGHPIVSPAEEFRTTHVIAELSKKFNDLLERQPTSADTEHGSRRNVKGVGSHG